MTVFISYATSMESKIKAIKKKLEYLGYCHYEPVVVEGLPASTKTERMKALVCCDRILFLSDDEAKDAQILTMESRVADYLGIEVITEADLNERIAEKAIQEMAEETTE